MRRIALLAALAAAALPASAAAAERVAIARGGDLYALGGGRPPLRLTRTAWAEYRPAWAPDGLRVAYLADRGTRHSLYLANADGSGVRLLLEGGVDSASWSPDGRLLAVARAGDRGFGLELVDAASGAARALPTGLAQALDPTWSPDGARIAFAGDAGSGFDVYTISLAGGRRRRLTWDAAGNVRPAWSPDGARVAYAAPGGILAVTPLGGEPELLARGDATSPAWSPDGRRLAFVRGGRVLVRGGGGPPRPLGGPGAADPAFGSPPARRLLLPDLDQLAPTRLVVVHSGGRFLLGFDAASVNRGDGPLHVRGERVGAGPGLATRQLVHLAGSSRTAVHPDAGVLRYTHAGGHDHWHLRRFMSYDLRTLDGGVLLRDHKSGFCLGDRRGRAFRAGARPLFGGFCGAGDPDLDRLDEGTSAGWVDRYSAFYHGQDLDLTGLPAGEYLLVHRVNASLQLLERDYGNDEASLRLRLTWPGGPESAPRVQVERACPATPTC